ncbi:malonyl-ACP O-methyltransferase BioC [Celerinatantimonas diazotrophica]|uniref:Malonyl-[acyl-carrier protein] O-methyltransferase n=1 Tax=Celerinatantimonas diazotrophica TaxID=412034 RepID=A0A4V2PR65_9GAMM|nr:malonyl-ACP O-methyltransferase BioC [Celerinatantimonas diazotrophica]TCK57621.1 pimeloyl-CoA biosynthesis protein BioC [Celerinatantimonas diazotrophica]CAG9298317.1 Malonyl-[acyl-carrier protein] O-methyltransferase [Celerinatantimonas diazotrophica]
MNTKTAIAECFGRAAHQYDLFASLQRQSGEKLWLLRAPEISVHRALDLGCGSGYFLSKLAKVSDHLIGLDLSRAMLGQSRQRDVGVDLVQGDAENLPLATQSCDLVFSNLALQWCEHLAPALAQCWRVLMPGGYCLWSSLVKGTLYELQQSFQVVDNAAHIRSFLTVEQVHNQVQQSAHWHSIKLYCEPMVLFYSNIRQLLRELKGFGANHLEHRRRGLMTPAQLKTLDRYYRAHFANDDQLPATYQIIYGVLVK